LVSNRSKSIQTEVGDEAHVAAEEQYLLEEQLLNVENSLIYRAGSERRQRAEFRTKVN
jgi:hypothetical protein